VSAERLKVGVLVIQISVVYMYSRDKLVTRSAVYRRDSGS